MWCASLLFFILVSRSLAAPLSSEKPVALFSCPKGAECYASPRNCVDDCDAAFSMWSEPNGTTTFNITMLSGLGYVALLVKDQGHGIYEKAVICSFHQPRGIVARVNYPDPIVIHEVELGVTRHREQFLIVEWDSRSASETACGSIAPYYDTEKSDLMPVFATGASASISLGGCRGWEENAHKAHFCCNTGKFFETTEPQGNTDSLHTQCSTNVAVPKPTKSEYKLLAGKWESELVLDERLGIDVVPAVENARILSTTPKLNIPPPKRVPAVRSSSSKDVDTEKTSEKKQFEKKISEEEKDKKVKDLRKKIEEEVKDDGDDVNSAENEENENAVKDTTTSTTTEANMKKNSKKNDEDVKEKEKQSEKEEEKSKKVMKDKDDEEEEEEEDNVEEKTTTKTRKGKKDDEEERPRFREYEDEDENREDNDPDDAPSISVLISITLSLLFFYSM